MEAFLEVRPRLLVADLHPDYPSAWLGELLAGERGGRLLRLQHHAAHGAAVLGENGRRPEPKRPCLCLVLDGTGYGPDRTAWGGEWLLLQEGGCWERLARLGAVPLVGGEAAVREPWRVAAAALALEGFTDWESVPLGAAVAPHRLQTAAALAHGSWPLATGAGRLFEAAGALFRLVAENRYEGEAAVRLESLAAQASSEDTWEEPFLASEGGLPVLPFGALLSAAARRIRDGEPPGRVAAGLHATFCRLAAEATARVLPGGNTPVAAGGGCLVNRLLREKLKETHLRVGVDLLLPWKVPPGDGGLAYGQAVLAAWSAP